MCLIRTLNAFCSVTMDKLPNTKLYYWIHNPNIQTVSQSTVATVYYENPLNAVKSTLECYSRISPSSSSSSTPRIYNTLLHLHKYRRNITYSIKQQPWISGCVQLRQQTFILQTGFQILPSLKWVIGSIWQKLLPYSKILSTLFTSISERSEEVMQDAKMCHLFCLAS